ncbi:BsuPI-related putative proteinase inhibitor [Halovivax gelatinilyticus]|uniref:BsuPI-related putative proteinase inhibitor n=1 Tax=Halovivax gelatinilyticus TaxID=2961597 RepID=UPI0020CA3EAA|nr:BsuPI-related putative proteinase inhibitor [Halovivax gelatinilyticus]
MSLTGSLETARDEDGITFTLVVTNEGDEPITARFSNGCRVDVAVTDDGGEIWRYTDGRMFTQVLGEETFEPGESRRFDVQWRDPEPGSYAADGELTAQNRTCTATTEFSV